MPLYSYHCKKCQKIFEAIIKLEDANKKIDCPYCVPKRKLKKIMTPVFFRMG